MRRGIHLIALVTGACALLPAHAQSPVVLEGERIFAESLDVGADGTLYVGSVGKGAVYRVRPGEAVGKVWIDKASGNLSAVTGVVADAGHDTLWVCSTDLNRLGEPVSLKSFRLQTGAPQADYPFPESKGLCNDIAVAADGTLYVTDTARGQIYRLRRGSKVLEPWSADQRLEGVDGIAIGPTGDILVNNVRSNLFYRIPIQADGSAASPSLLVTTRPLDGPDGLRPTGDGRYLLAENRGGRISLLSFDGETVRVDTIADGLDSPAGVTVSGDVIWTVEMKAKYRSDPALKNLDPGPSLMRSYRLPKR